MTDFAADKVTDYDVEALGSLLGAMERARLADLGDRESVRGVDPSVAEIYLDMRKKGFPADVHTMGNAEAIAAFRRMPPRWDRIEYEEDEDGQPF